MKSLLLSAFVLATAHLAFAQSNYTTPYTISHFAGYDPTADGKGSAAGFYRPSSVAVDANGYAYVADTNNSTIRRISPSGIVTTFAGSPGITGTADGKGGAAQFNFPHGVAVDASGNVYVADTFNQAIRKISSAGVVTTLAGLAGTSGTKDGQGSAAEFNAPNGLAVDAGGNVYVADTNNSTIRKITPAGLVTTLAGTAGVIGHKDGKGTVALFNGPNGVAVDAHGNVYVADTGNHTLRKITSAGVVTTLAGLAEHFGSKDGLGNAARFTYPYGVAVDVHGNLYVADEGNDTFRKVSAAGAVTTLAGTAGQSGSTDGQGGAARFYDPQGVAVTSTGAVYVADTDNDTVREISPAGLVSTVAGLAGSTGSNDGKAGAARFYDPAGVALDGHGNVYVADEINNTIRKITSEGVVTTLAGLAGLRGSNDGQGSAARFYTPVGVAVDAAGNVYITDANNLTVRKITAKGLVTTLAGSAGVPGSADGQGSAARFNFPGGVAVDAAGNVFVTDTNNGTIRKITPTGKVTTVAGLAGNSGLVNGKGKAARFDNPSAVAVDSDGYLYIADENNHAIRKVSPSGIVTTLAGAGVSGSIDGKGGAARFFSPQGLAVDVDGNVYVADTANSLIRKISPSGVVSTLAGLGGSAGTSDGQGSAARFNFPFDVTVDPRGRIYVADKDAIRVGVPEAPHITSAASLSVLVGSHMAYQITADSSPVVFSLSGTLPAGLSFAAETGRLSGTPTKASRYVLTLAASNAGGTSKLKLALSVLKPQTITFADLANRPFSTKSFTLTAKASSGLTIAYTATGPVKISHGVATLTGVGEVKIRASQAGNGSYAAAESILRSFKVTKGPQTIKFPAIANQRVTHPPITLKATSSSGLPITYAVFGKATLSGDKVTLTGAGPVRITADQRGNKDYLAAATETVKFDVVK